MPILPFIKGEITFLLDLLGGLNEAVHRVSMQKVLVVIIAWGIGHDILVAQIN